MSEALKYSTPISLPFLSPYADWLSLIVTLCMTGKRTSHLHTNISCNSSFLFLVILSVGVKSSSVFTNIFTFLNLSVVLFVITVGAAHGNWSKQIIRWTWILIILRVQPNPTIGVSTKRNWPMVSVVRVDLFRSASVE